MKNMFLLISTTILFYGCSSTYIIQNDYLAYNQLNSKLNEKQCEITLTNGDTYLGSDFEIVRNSTSWYESNKVSIITKPISEIHKITFTNRSSGMGKGFGFGFLTGAVIGGLIGKGNEKKGGSGFVSAPNYEGLSTEFGALIGAFSGGIVGGIFGTTKGDRDIYILNPLNEIITKHKSHLSQIKK